MKKTLATLACMTLIGLTGCQSTGGSDGVAYSDIVGDITPEMRGLTQRPVDRHAALKYANNENVRMLWDDVARSMYLNRSSRLSPHAVYSQSGMPQ